MDHALAEKTITLNTPEKNEFLPIASVSKNFMGLTTILFLFDKNSDLLKNNNLTIAPENLTIGNILKSREEQLTGLGDKATALQKEKLEKVKKWLQFSNQNEIFDNTTIKSLLNHTSAIKQQELSNLGYIENPTIFLTREEAGVELDKRGIIISAEKFIELLSREYAFDENNLGTHIYNNTAFTLAGEIMGLMTDKETFFEETRDRVLTPLGISDSIMPYYEVPLNKRERFKGEISLENGSFSTTESAYSKSRADCSVTGGGLSATMEALQKYGVELAKFYSDQESVFKIDGNRKPSEIFDKFSIMESPENLHKVYSLGLSLDTEIKNPNYKHFHHNGALNPHFTSFDIYVKPEGIKTEINYYKHDVCCEFIDTTRVLLTSIPRYSIYKLYGKTPNVEEKTVFKQQVRTEIEKIKIKPIEEKKEIAEDFSKITCVLMMDNEKVGNQKKELLKNAFQEISKTNIEVLKLFVDKFQAVSGLDSSKETSKGRSSDK